MDTRRDFMKKAALLSGAAAWNGVFPESISKALAINPEPGSTFLDAEHVVILMQENRSFDHCFGTMKGVRGFNDPRAIQLPNGNPVWLQSNAAGETYAPWRFDIKDTKITWMGSTPHSRSSQVDANNDGKYDNWLESKKVGNKGYSHIPMTMGYYTREDVPFNYALADAFTVCDQNFCSAMTSTWPNRLFLWSGTIRGEQKGDAKAFVRNNIKWGEAQWTTFPELLEKHSVSWKVYQNDVTAGGGYAGEERAWLSNFGCNLLEEFTQFNVRFSDRYVAGLQAQVRDIPEEIAKLQKELAALTGESALVEASNGKVEAEKNAKMKASKIEKLKKDIAKKEAVLKGAQEELALWNKQTYDQLSPEAKSLYAKAFTCNEGDPDFRKLANYSYEKDGEKRELDLPKGDILHQFRQDVDHGKLPTVSWLVAPANLTDHPSTPWYGSWYVSEVLDVLTKNPKVWAKTIFIMTYDENDGYFDHVPPFVAPDPNRPETGKCSAGIDTAVEYIRREHELNDGVPGKEAREGPIGLGFRVPMIVASPWSRGGRVCSQVLDHTSVFRFVQEFLNRKTGSQISETNISLWRKTVTGDLTSAFRPYEGGEVKLPFLERAAFVESIYNAKFKTAPNNFKALTPEEVAQANGDRFSSSHLPQQEPGVKPSCALPYELYAEGRLSEDKKSVVVRMEARKEIFGAHAAGSPFNIHLPGKYAVVKEPGKVVFENVGSRSYAVAAGDAVADSFPLLAFENGLYHLRTYGPNGFFRECRGNAGDPNLVVRCEYERSPGKEKVATGNLLLSIENNDSEKSYQIEIRDHAYKAEPIRKNLAPGKKSLSVVINLGKSFGWYDLGISANGFENFERRYAGRVETGKEGFSDPAMGRMV